MTDLPLAGGIANAGAVIRRGPHVLRPSGPYTASIHTALRGLRAAGFEGVPAPVGVDPDGRERLVYIEGDVALPPYPAWSRSDTALVSMTRLVKGLHDASTDLAIQDLPWSSEMADPTGGDVLCHNDVCLENVVFDGEEAIAILDFEFAAPGRRAWDVAAFARLCVPIDDPANKARLGWESGDGPARLRLIADTYGLDEQSRIVLIDSLDRAMDSGGEFVRRRVEAGDPGFVKMWRETGGAERYEVRRLWWVENRPAFLAELSR